MKSFKTLSLMLLLFVAAFSISSCRQEGCTNAQACNFDPDADKDDGSCELKGTVTFWQRDNSGYNYTDVTIGGTTVVITSEYTNTPNCNASGCANFTLCPGTYSYYAEEQFPGTAYWSGTVVVNNNGCLTIELQ
jgi:hypothetical protein